MLESPQVKRIIVMVNRSWKLEGPKSFLAPPQIYFIRRQRNCQKDLDGGLKNCASSILDLQKIKKVFFFWKLPQKNCSFSRYETKNPYNTRGKCLYYMYKDNLGRFGMVWYGVFLNNSKNRQKIMK